ncbi:MAG: DPP IV N-terminal domain-containing protein [Gemmatimonadota bacterium]|jgi:dipeptidyl aminopeptidase/acylaminoacyl peptidase
MRLHCLWQPLFTLSFCVLAAVPADLTAQGTLEDYQRADSFDARSRGLVVDVAEDPNWIGGTSRFWYRKSVEGGNRFVLVDPSGPTKGPAFDHGRLAAALSAERGDTLTATTLPFSRFQFVDDEGAIRFTLEDSTWVCGLLDYACENQGPVPEREGRPGGGGSGVGYQAGPGQLWRNNTGEPVPSPDGEWEALIHNHNLAVRRAGEEEHRLLSHDGSEGNVYTRRSILWSPDSRRLVVYRVIPGHQRQVHYVESSPDDQLQPKHSTLTYAKPGDVLDKEHPVVFDVETGRQIDVDDTLFPNAYTLSRLSWREDGRRLTFEYNQRGHRFYRVIEIDATTGSTRAVISEEPETFFDYSGKRFREDVTDGEEIIWMSERDGWNHLYLYDGVTGEVKNQITKGEWVVRGVDHVDEDNRQIWFRASGMDPDQDPYFVHYYRINFDGTGLVAFTEADGTHTVTYSPGREYYVDRWSRVDHPPVAELRRTSDQGLVMSLERADASALLATGWRYPEVFTAKGRDGVTDIWGIIVRPTNFDPGRTYPVIEYIYAGPHSSHVPKSFSTQRGMQATAELGFIVAQIDGMGTSNRSKAFHDVSWKNIGDAGFPDRILWHRAVAARHGHYDISNVGIYGNSAGGQNAMAALLFHPDFYKVSVSTSGCHDNRMDKIWWNELWMSWPLGPHYDASSNVVNAHKLEGKLFLLVPEMDTNVDPASTMQVVDALIQAGKDFDFMVVPGANHGSGGSFGVRKRYDFFVRHILGKEPPAWNQIQDAG